MISSSDMAAAEAVGMSESPYEFFVCCVSLRVFHSNVFFPYDILGWTGLNSRALLKRLDKMTWRDDEARALIFLVSITPL